MSRETAANINAETDRLLVARVVEHGDSGAFEQIVKRHQPALRAWLRRMLPGSDPSVADDLAQETFLRAFRGLATFRGGSALRTWITRIAFNVLRDHQRSRSVWHENSDEALSEDPYDAPNIAETATMSADIERALLELNPTQRTVVLLACWADQSHSEIAELTHLPLGTVKTHFRRALHRLAGRLKENV